MRSYLIQNIRYSIILTKFIALGALFLSILFDRIDLEFVTILKFHSLLMSFFKIIRDG